MSSCRSAEPLIWPKRTKEFFNVELFSGGPSGEKALAFVIDSFPFRKSARAIRESRRVFAWRPLLFASLSVASLLIQSPLQAGYPDHFVWGAGLSAHQSEGYSLGHDQSDWWRLEHSLPGAKSPLPGQANADLANGFWQNYEQDLDAARAIGLNTLRTSVAWEKIEPSPGAFSRQAIQHYRKIFLAMRERGLQPMVALHHFTHPLWFQERGGWISPDSPRLFLRYASFVVEELKDVCDLWITFEEPMTLVRRGYLEGTFPPHLTSAETAFEAAFQLARAHRLAVSMIRDIQGTSPGAKDPEGRLRGVGLTQLLDVFTPADPVSPEDQKATRAHEEFVNWAFIEGLTRGVIELRVPATIGGPKAFRRPLPEQDLPPWDVGPPLDWLGVNYFTRHRVSHDSKRRGNSGRARQSVTDQGWEIYPDGLEKVLRESSRRFAVPLVVTQNGLADARDHQRSKFIREHLQSLDWAVLGGSRGSPLDVRGYYHWSLLDQFEWLSGYEAQYGLIEVDRSNSDLRRQPRASADTYRAGIRASHRN